jgi:hypothetical protein
MKQKLNLVLLVALIFFANIANAQNVLELNNGFVHVKLDLSHGGAFSYISQADSTTNLVNAPDNGRFISQRYYAGQAVDRTAAGQFSGTTPWYWDADQAGDIEENSSTIIDSYSKNDTLYVKTQPLLYDMNNELAQCYIEQWVTLDSNGIHVRNKLTTSRTDNIWDVVPRWNDLPHAFLNTILNNQYSYTGDKPWTSGTLSKIAASGSGWDYFNATEHWAAEVNDNNWGLGIYNKDCVNFAGGNVSAYSFTHLSPLNILSLDKNTTFEYDYYIILGTLDQIRQYAYKLGGSSSDTALATVWNFKNTANNWYAGNNISTVVSDSALTLNVTGGDPYLLSPFGLNIDASKYKYLTIKMKNNTNDISAQLFWRNNSDLGYDGTRTASFTITPNDTSYTTYSIDMSRFPAWTGRIEQLRFDAVNSVASGSVNLAQIKIDTASSSNIALDNGVVIVKMDPVHGGAISYISKSGTTDNLVNAPDNGRYIEQRYYAGQNVDRTVDGQFSGTTPWYWDADQAGDIYGNTPGFIVSYNAGNALYTKTQPLLYDMKTDTAQCYIEQWVTLDSNAIHVKNKLTTFRTDNIWEVVAHWNEFPHAFLSPTLNNQYSYTDDQPWTNGGLTKIINGGAAWDYYNATEHWAAEVNDSKWGLGIYNKNCVYFAGGCASAYGLTHLGPLNIIQLDKSSTYEYDYYIILGTVDQIRQYAYKLGGTTSDTALATDWDFSKGMNNWYVGNNISDTVENSVVKLSVTGSDPYIKSPYGLNVDAGKYKYVSFTMKNTTSDTSAQIWWQTNSDVSYDGSMQTTVTLIPSDTGFTTYNVDLSKNSAWTGRIEQLRLDPVNGVSTGSIELKEVKFLTTMTSVKNDNAAVPVKFELSQNYPNPFNPTTQIKYSIPKDGMVTLKIYNLLGQEVARLVNQQQKSGYYNITFNASKLASGVYMYKIQAGDYNLTKKMMLLK